MAQRIGVYRTYAVKFQCFNMNIFLNLRFMSLWATRGDDALSTI